MTGGPPDPWARARRSLRWYPAPWRDRYGEEFCELLAAEIADRPSSVRRSLDVVAGGIMARLADAGLSGVTIDRPGRPRRGLATFGCSIALFLTIAMSVYSHLDLAQRWAQPAASATSASIVLMTLAVWICLALAVVGAAPLVFSATRAVVSGRAPHLRSSSVVCLASASFVVAGSVYFGGGWSGPGGPGAVQSPGQGWPTALMWAASLAVSSYWVHPAMVARLPLGQIAWMAVSPVALAAVVVSAARIIRRVDIPARLVGFSIRVARVMILPLGVFVFGVVMWLVDGGPGPDRLFQAGTVDFVGLGVMSVALGVSALSVHRAAETLPVATG